MTDRPSKADVLADLEKSRLLTKQLELKIAAAKRDPARQAEVLAVAEQARDLDRAVQAKLAQAAAQALKLDWRDVLAAHS